MSRVEVDVKQVALQKIAVRVIGAEPKIRIVKALVGLADPTAERQEDVFILIKGDEFDRIPKIVPFRWIGQKAPILFVTRKRIQSARERSRSFLSYHSIRPCNDHKQYQRLRDPKHCLHSALTRPSEWFAFFAATRLALQSRVERQHRAEYCCCPAVRLNVRQRHGGSERNCRSNRKRLNLKDVGSCQTDEFSTMVKNW